jgi:hypothetical protein
MGYVLAHIGGSFRIAGMAKKKLTAAERLLDEQLLALLEWATEPPWLAQDWVYGRHEEGGRAARETRRDRGLERDRSISAQTANALESTDGRGTQFSTVTG